VTDGGKLPVLKWGNPPWNRE